MLDPAERADAIWHDATKTAFAPGFEVVDDKGLLAEVAGLVEWPVVLMGKIGDDFLGLPPEVLQTSMREHQKFFSVGIRKLGGSRASSPSPIPRQRITARRSLRATRRFCRPVSRTPSSSGRTTCGPFAKGLEGMAEGLANVTFHNKLGSQKDRIDRIEALAREIAPLVGAKPDLAAEAARVAKADLQSAMVCEFPELQGMMGRITRGQRGCRRRWPDACRAHYPPLGPSDAVPTAPVSVAVALADKIDTLTGFWAIDEKPTGSKDPLRAAAGGAGGDPVGAGRTGCGLA